MSEIIPRSPSILFLQVHAAPRSDKNLLRRGGVGDRFPRPRSFFSIPSDARPLVSLRQGSSLLSTNVSPPDEWFPPFRPPIRSHEFFYSIPLKLLFPLVFINLLFYLAYQVHLACRFFWESRTSNFAPAQ